MIQNFQKLDKIFQSGQKAHLHLESNPLALSCFEEIAQGIGKKEDFLEVTLNLNAVKIPIEPLNHICEALEKHKVLEILTLNLKKYHISFKVSYYHSTHRNGLKASDVDDGLEKLGKLTSLKEINLNMEKNEAPGLNEDEILNLFANAEDLVGINIKLEKDL